MSPIFPYNRSRTRVSGSACLTLLLVAQLFWPSFAYGEGSAQLTPNNGGSSSATNVTNTFVGYLQHEDGANSNSFLKPSTYGGFNADHRLYIHLEPGETVYYGVRRIQTNAGGNQNDLILTLRYGSGAGTIARDDTLARDTGSSNHATLLPQAGVIADHAEALAGPQIGGSPVGGYDPLSWTNSTDSALECFIEFTQVNEGSLGAARKSWYDCWDFTVVDEDDNVKPGRLYSKQWSFTAGSGNNRLSATFNFFPLIPSEDDTTTFYVKQVELAGIRPWGFLFLCNSEGTTSGASLEDRRKSQTSNTGYAEYNVFVQDPDTAIWPSAGIEAQVVSATPYCNGLDEGNVLITYLASGAGEAELIVNLDGVAGYQAGGRDRRFTVTFPAAGYYNLNWNGLDGNGDPVASGEATTIFFTLKGGVVHFPLWDVERNPDGFRIRDVRPDTGWAFLHWDDSNLPASDFSPQTELDGVLSNTGVHSWGGSSDVGNNRLVNTWSYGTVAVDSFNLTLTFDCDFDNDGVTNSVDIDDDNDGILDSLEHAGVQPYGDHDGDTIANFQDADFVHPSYGAFRDLNADGINDLFDADGDGLPNFRDVDADGDGLPDGYEANGGAKPASFNDSTGRVSGAVGLNGLPDAIETGVESGTSTYALTDTDGDGRPDYRDQDSDNDGITDNVEFYASGAVVEPDGADADLDGLDDAYDGNQSGSLASPLDFDAIYPSADGVPDYKDDDTDGDGYPDWWEGFDDDNSGWARDDLLNRGAAFEASQGDPGYYPDTDADVNGLVDWLDTLTCPDMPNMLCHTSPWFRDSDADGLIDLFDEDDGGTPSLLPDMDGINGADFRDNNTGIPLPIELLGFEAFALPGEGIRLQWQTAAELGMDQYRIHRIGLQGQQTLLAKQQAMGGPEQPWAYQWTDLRPLAGQNVYALEPLNTDGGSEPMVYAAARWTPERPPFRAWPSPFGAFLNLAADADQVLELRGPEGGLRWTGRALEQGGLRIQTGEWPSGNYWLCPQGLSGPACQQLVKLR